MLSRSILTGIRLRIVISLLFAFALSGTKVLGQGIREVRINEVLVDNKTNYQDGYGNHSAWIELFNPTAASVNLGGCYLTDDLNNLKKYPIPKGDVLTKVPPRQHILFFSDGMASRGTSHTSFSPVLGKPNFVAFVASDGKTIIDSITVPATLPTDASYGRIPDGVNLADEPNVWQVIISKVTPGSNNLVVDPNERLEAIKDRDPYGVAMTITAMLVVFLGLLALYLAFKYISLFTLILSKRRTLRASSEKPVKYGPPTGFVRGEVAAAIGMALYSALNEVHDHEEDVLTLRHAERKYSPWSSKIYGLRTPLPRVRNK